MSELYIGLFFFYGSFALCKIDTYYNNLRLETAKVSVFKYSDRPTWIFISNFAF